MTSTADSPFGKYGLGIHGTKLPDGTIVWGHGGGIPGFTNFAGGTEDGQHVISININVLGNADKHINDILASEFAREAKKELKEEEKKSKHREEVKCVMDEVITNKRVPSIVAGGLQDGETLVLRYRYSQLRSTTPGGAELFIPYWKHHEDVHRFSCIAVG